MEMTKLPDPREGEAWILACNRIRHDLRAVARNVKELSEWVMLDIEEAGDPIPESAAEALAHLQGLGAQLAVYTGDLDKFLRVGAGVSGVADMSAVLNEVLKNLDVPAEMQIVQDVESVDAPLAGQELSILLEALVSNAVRHSGRSDASILIAARNDVDGFLLTVSDNGVGIKPVQYQDAFDFGRRLTNNWNTNGFGLATVKRLCALRGGDITLGPVPDGDGMVASVRLPAC